MEKRKTNTTNDFYRIVTEKLPLIDVRAPIEYEKGAFLNSVNLPLMNDEERRLVGICYKEKGNEEAVKLGHELVCGDIKNKRVDAWKSYINEHPNVLIYCFRGGQRSGISQEWIKEATGKDILRLEGGYKAFRNYLIDALLPSSQEATPILLGGCTGSGKTILLKKLKNSVDLEGIAHHRGSSFGHFITPQPTQINFENNLAYALIKHRHEKNRYLILEDESRNIGKCVIPKPLFEHFQKGKLVLMDVSLENRVEITMEEYVVNSQANYINLFGQEKGLSEWFNYMSGGINKLKKRFGMERYEKVRNLFEDAFKEQMCTDKNDLHRNWIEILLRDYYDPMYKYEIEKNKERILFKGNSEEVLDYFNELK